MVPLPSIEASSNRLDPAHSKHGKVGVNLSVANFFENYFVGLPAF